jgi:glutamate--cysteine ligase
MEYGFQGQFPTLDDWRYHLTTLFPEVRPKGFLELRSADAQSRAFWSVPLTWWSALLCDDDNLRRLLVRLAPTAPELPDRYAAACREGPANPELGADCKFVYGLAADALLRFPTGVISLEMQQAFVAFGDLFTLKDRCPGDAIFELFLVRGFDRGAWEALEADWLEKAGVQVGS